MKYYLRTLARAFLFSLLFTFFSTYVLCDTSTLTMTSFLIVIFPSLALTDDEHGKLPHFEVFTTNNETHRNLTEGSFSENPDDTSIDHFRNLPPPSPPQPPLYFFMGDTKGLWDIPEWLFETLFALEWIKIQLHLKDPEDDPEFYTNGQECNLKNLRTNTDYYLKQIIPDQLTIIILFPVHALLSKESSTITDTTTSQNTEPMMCSICLSEVRHRLDKKPFNCEHTEYHAACIMEWVLRLNNDKECVTCPMCRAKREEVNDAYFSELAFGEHITLARQLLAQTDLDTTDYQYFQALQKLLTNEYHPESSQREALELANRISMTFKTNIEHAIAEQLTLEQCAETIAHVESIAIPDFLQLLYLRYISLMKENLYSGLPLPIENFATAYRYTLMLFSEYRDSTAIHLAPQFANVYCHRLANSRTRNSNISSQQIRDTMKEINNYNLSVANRRNLREKLIRSYIFNLHQEIDTEGQSSIPDMKEFLDLAKELNPNLSQLSIEEKWHLYQISNRYAQYIIQNYSTNIDLSINDLNDIIEILKVTALLIPSRERKTLILRQLEEARARVVLDKINGGEEYSLSNILSIREELISNEADNLLIGEFRFLHASLTLQALKQRTPFTCKELRKALQDAKAIEGTTNRQGLLFDSTHPELERHYLTTCSSVERFWYKKMVR